MRSKRTGKSWKSQNENIYIIFRQLFATAATTIAAAAAVLSFRVLYAFWFVLNNSSHMFKYKFRMQHKFRAIIMTCCAARVACQHERLFVPMKHFTPDATATVRPLRNSSNTCR